LNIEGQIRYLEQTLSPARFTHSLGVMGVMEELAPVYGLHPEKARAAGLLHDAAKELAPDRQAQIEAQAGIERRCEQDNNFHLYLHGPVGAHLVKKELGIHDPDILDAIAFHTYYGYGENFDAAMTWCLRFADVIEPARDWHNIRWLRKNAGRLAEVAFAGHLKEGAFLQSGWLIKWFEEDGIPVHPNMYRVFGALSRELGKDETYL
jgi:predicted HD superfamily hydrolase involved in NAD metabolism